MKVILEIKRSNNHFELHYAMAPDGYETTDDAENMEVCYTEEVLTRTGLTVEKCQKFIEFECKEFTEKALNILDGE